MFLTIKVFKNIKKIISSRWDLKHFVRNVFFTGNLVPTFLSVVALFGLVFLIFDCLATIQKIENNKK